VEMEVGLTYHFKNSNGEHYMTLCPYRYSQEDIDVLNGKINDLRNQLSKAQADLNAANARADQLARDLEACKQLKNKVVEVDKTGEQLMTNVFFKVNKWDITRDQQPNVERVAIYLKNHKDATVDIKGYASPEGPLENNIKLANNRAAAVKDMLVNKYGIKANRINAEGQGIGNMFSELEWNRVSVCTINDDKK
ncbi:MAG: OmpA family protein, partial [Muribaculaceae bacterium]|nr:OmpA family protein [Muribaculaceae bacterium]